MKRSAYDIVGRKLRRYMIRGFVLAAVMAAQACSGANPSTYKVESDLVKLESSPVADLSRYHPQTSLENVDISFGANRVESVTLVQVKVFYTDGHTVTMPLNLHP